MAEGSKTCTKCGETKELAEFERRSGRDAQQSACKVCRRAAVKAYNQRLAERDVIERPAFHRCSHCKQTLPGTAFALNRTKKLGIQNICLGCYRARKYGLDARQCERMLAEQGGVCAICQRACPTNEALSVDHDHSTNVVRGMLCQPCNAGLGLFHEDQGRMARAIEYLKSAVNDA